MISRYEKIKDRFLHNYKWNRIYQQRAPNQSDKGYETNHQETTVQGTKQV